MRDPFTWSLPLGRMFGVTVRMHILFPFFILVLWARAAMDDKSPRGAGLEMLILMALLFVAVLLHELGHCFGARLMDGDADEVLLWPLGGLARCDIPNTPRAHFWTAAYGPLTNLLLCVLAGGVLAAFSFVPSFDPRVDQCWDTLLYNYNDGRTYGSEFSGKPLLDYGLVLVARFFWVNWFLFLLNVLIIGFPLDGGRMFQALLWPRLGYRQSMQFAIFAGFLFMFVIAFYALAFAKEPILLVLAWFIYVTCKQEWIQLETGGEDSLFGYDFSQGYTSLERDEQPAAPPRKKKRANFFQRWLQKRAARKLQREQEQEAADELRMDELLDKIARSGKESLTDEENRFLKRVSDKYRNRP
jgi:stage IV sporulation protein FB